MQHRDIENVLSPAQIKFVHKNLYAILDSLEAYMDSLQKKMHKMTEHHMRNHVLNISQCNTDNCYEAMGFDYTDNPLFDKISESIKDGLAFVSNLQTLMMSNINTIKFLKESRVFHLLKYSKQNDEVFSDVHKELTSNDIKLLTKIYYIYRGQKILNQYLDNTEIFIQKLENKDISKDAIKRAFDKFKEHKSFAKLGKKLTPLNFTKWRDATVNKMPSQYSKIM